MQNYHIKKGDEVKVIAGDAKGKTGTIVAILPKTDRVVVGFTQDVRDELAAAGKPLGKRTLRKSQANPNGGQIDRDFSTHVSNVKKVEKPAAQ